LEWIAGAENIQRVLSSLGLFIRDILTHGFNKNYPGRASTKVIAIVRRVLFPTKPSPDRQGDHFAPLVVTMLA
jgi:hypothetical protein